MALNLSSLSPITTAATALSNLILVSPQRTIGYQPQNPSNPDGSPSMAQQPPSILFHYEGEQSVNLESDITDHYIEDNTAIQDQISLKPETVTTHGFIGELNDVAPSALKLLKVIADKLTVVSAYTPQLSETALIAYSEAFQLYQVAQNAINSGIAAWSSINGLFGNTINDQNVINSSGLGEAFDPRTGKIFGYQNKQQTYFQLFYGYWRSRTLFTVQTPWAVFQNMAIKNLRPVQDAESRMITDFEVTFKMIRTAVTANTPNIALTQAGRNALQARPLVDFGSQPGTGNQLTLSEGLSGMGAP